MRLNKVTWKMNVAYLAVLCLYSKNIMNQRKWNFPLFSGRVLFFSTSFAIDRAKSPSFFALYIVHIVYIDHYSAGTLLLVNSVILFVIVVDIISTAWILVMLTQWAAFFLFHFLCLFGRCVVYGFYNCHCRLLLWHQDQVVSQFY